MSLLHSFVQRFFLILNVLLLASCNVLSVAPGPSAAAGIGGGGGGGGGEEPPKDPSLAMTSTEIVTQFSEVSCDPLDQGPPQDGEELPDYFRGLKGKVRIPPTGYQASQWENLDRYAQPDAITLEEPVFLSHLNVPTRAFDRGFPTLSGEVIKNNNNQTLIEHFRIDMDGFLELPEDMPEGDYEFAFLSDDGVRFKVNGNSLVAHPGITPTKLMCATQRVNMSHGTRIPMSVAYFQGPRYHIALMLLWRPYRASDAAESMCGHAGNNLWFDSSFVPSIPQFDYFELQRRRWSVVPPEAYRVPLEERLNPCLSTNVRQTIDAAN